MTYRFKFDGRSCVGCMACAVACMDEKDFDPEKGTPFRRVEKKESGVFPEAKIAFASLSCLHCPKASCLEACPSGAIRKDPATGIVEVEAEACTGCRLCHTACSIAAPTFGEDGKMEKCDLCRGRLAEGLEPACARTCPTGALQVERKSPA